MSDVLDSPNGSAPSIPEDFSAIIGQLTSSRASDEAGHRVVHVVGELDIASRDAVTRLCVERDPEPAGDDDVVLDMAALTFMDCAGFGGVVAARQVLHGRGGTLTLTNATGEPARLMRMLDEMTARPVPIAR